jgi:hypothetical protein
LWWEESLAWFCFGFLVEVLWGRQTTVLYRDAVGELFTSQPDPCISWVDLAPADFVARLSAREVNVLFLTMVSPEVGYELCNSSENVTAVLNFISLVSVSSPTNSSVLHQNLDASVTYETLIDVNG